MKKIALYLNNLDEEYQISIYREVKKETLKRGMNLLCIQGELSNFDNPFDIDGILLLTSVIKNIPFFKPIIPTISVGDIIEGIPSVVINSRNSMIELMDHLIIDHNYKSFLYVGGPRDHHENIEREKAFIDSLNGKKDPEINFDIINGDFYENSGTICMQQYIKSHENKSLDVIVCASDHIAIGVYKAINYSKNSNWLGVKITGFDDISNIDGAIPGLTTIKQPIKELANTSLNIMCNMLGNKRVKQKTSINSKPVFRTSCGCLKKKKNKIKSPIVEPYSLTISYFGQSLTRVESYEELINHLKILLQIMNINLYYLLIKNSSDEYNLIYKKDGIDEELFLNSEQSIDFNKIFDSSINPTPYILYHLLSRDKKIGMVIYKCEESILSNLCTSSAFMTNAVNQLRIIEMEKKRSSILEKEVNKRTFELININRSLQEEIQRRIEVEAEVLKISEMERKRISLDLHDDICQSIAGISMFTKSFPSTPVLQELSNLLDDTLKRTREYAHNSFPMELSNLGLKRSIEDLFQTIKDQSGIKIDIDWDEYNFSMEEQINIFRIVQEAIQNSLKHSNATTLSIKGKLDSDKYKISIIDNGQGKIDNLEKPKINKLKRDRPRGLGLKSMDYRAHQIGAIYKFNSTKSNGTSVDLELPILKSTQ